MNFMPVTKLTMFSSPPPLPASRNRGLGSTSVTSGLRLHIWVRSSRAVLSVLSLVPPYCKRQISLLDAQITPHCPRVLCFFHPFYLLLSTWVDSLSWRLCKVLWWAWGTGVSWSHWVYFLSHFKMIELLGHTQFWVQCFEDPWTFSTTVYSFTFISTISTGSDFSRPHQYYGFLTFDHRHVSPGELVCCHVDLDSLMTNAAEHFPPIPPWLLVCLSDPDLND